MKKIWFWLRLRLRNRYELQNFAEIFSQTAACIELKFSQVII